jgi:predicted phage-related endonuclease
MKLNVEQRVIITREQWLADRQPLLTASVMGAAAGLDPYKSRLHLHLEKAGLVPPQEETPLMKRGRILEGAAIEYIYEAFPGWKVMRPKVLLVDREHRIGGTPDLLIEDPDEPGIINCQIKVVGRPTFESWDGEPPAAYQLQVATENMLLDARTGMLAVLVLSAYDAHLETFPIPRHAKAEAKVLEIATEFWDRVDRGVLPPVDYDRDAETVARIYPPDPAKTEPLDLTSDNRIYLLLEDRDRLKAVEKDAVAKCEAIDAELIEKLAGSTYAVANGWKNTRLMAHRKEYTVKAAEYPVLRVARTTEAA